MDTAHRERMIAAELAADNVIAVLYRQHARIRDLFDAVLDTTGEERRAAFDELRALLAAHEVAEEVVLRPVTEKLVPAAVTRARNDEEREAARELADIEGMDPEDAEFAPRLRLLAESVALHAAREEAEEFPAVLGEVSQEQQAEMGRRLLRAAELAPTHPHPAVAGSPVGQAVLGPFAALADRARDRLAEK